MRDVTRRPLQRTTARITACLLPLLLMQAGCQPGESPSHRREETRQPRTGVDPGLQKARTLRVQDGDSFVARLADGTSRTIRLSGIDAPERTQPHADQSQQNLRRLLENRDLQVHVAKTDAYGRSVAQVFVSAEGGPIDVGLAQVTAGMAWFYRHYRQDLPAAASGRYAEAEQKAREARRGLWQADDPQPPWDFRRNKEADGRANRR